MASIVPLLLVLLAGLTPVLLQDLRETDAFCTADGCFVVNFQPKTFLDSWRTCKERGGNLATIKRREDADAISSLFSTLDLRGSRTRVQVWIGLQRQPRHCAPNHPLRGFSWTTGDQDTEFTNWLTGFSSETCSVPRCAMMGYSSKDLEQNLRWLDRSCSVPVDGFLCHFAYQGMCPPLWGDGVEDIVYITPFSLSSSILTQVPLGSEATIYCPEEDRLVLCVRRDDGYVGWSLDPPFCSGFPSPSLCDLNNGGCEQICHVSAGMVLCECLEGYELGEDGRGCVCRGSHCPCPDGYLMDQHGCVDVNECLENPCDQICENTAGSFRCRCQQGFFPNQEDVCEDVDECADNPCHHDCENIPGSYTCLCAPGFHADPENPGQCQDVDECRIPGTCEQMCWNYDGGFACYCEEGYELMPDQLSCQKMGEEKTQPAASPPFVWPTAPPRSVWDPMDYDYTTDDEWLPDPTGVFDPKVIWVTKAPLKELPFETQTIFSDLLPEAPPTEDLPSTPTVNTPDLYDDYDEETTEAPLLSTITTSGGAWHWWSEFTTHDRLDQMESEVPEPEEHDPVESTSPLEERGREESGWWREEPTEGPTESPVPQFPLGGTEEDTNTWLLVSILVPIVIFIVLMVVVGIIYCTRCGPQPRSKTETDCYHWISGSGTSNPPAGAKTSV